MRGEAFQISGFQLVGYCSTQESLDIHIAGSFLSLHTLNGCCRLGLLLSA